MKFFFFLLLCSFACFSSEAQILKKLGKKIQNDSEWRIRYKADQELNKGLDSLMAAPKKINEKKKAEKSSSKTTTTEKQDNNNNDVAINKNGTTNINPSAPDDNDMTPEDGFITIFLSATSVFTGGLLSITGESINYKNFNKVEITVSGPGVKDIKSILLNTDGKFAAAWYAPDKPGDYAVTVKGSDNKSTQSVDFKVFELQKLTNWCDENIDLTNKAYDNLKEQVDQVKSSIGTKDKEELDNKLAELKDKVEALIKLFTDLNAAGKETARLAKSGKNIPANLANNLSLLNDKLAEERKKMQQLEEYNTHKATENTVCEYLVLVNEACAAFSVYTNIEGLALKAIVKEIVSDKVAPKVAGMLNEKTVGLSEPNDIALKEPAKIYATSLLDAEAFTSKLNTANFAGDMIQFATDVLMKKYCGVFKGSLKHNYTIEFRNSNGENWWTYGVEMKAALFLRYPKNKGDGKIIKMKGNLEGNGTKFSFFTDVEKEDGFHEGSKGKIEVVPIKTFTPLAVSEATSERDILGFGAIARGMATPAYFNIPVDAEYDVNADKIKIFLNTPIIDFSPAVTNQFVFLLVGGDLLPYIKRMVFPIHKANITLGSVIRSNNEFTVDRDSKGNLSFAGKGNKHIGDKSTVRETDLNFTISAKKE